MKLIGLKMKNIHLFIFVLFILFVQCNSSDFEQNSDGLMFKFIVTNENGAKPKIGDFVELKIRYADSKDSLMFDSKEIAGSFRVELKQENRNRLSIEAAILMMRVGEKALFKMVADSFYINNKNEKRPVNIDKSSLLTFDIELISILDANEVKIEREVFVRNRKKAEDDILKQYLILYLHILL